jgi:hypothetical protein
MQKQSLYCSNSDFIKEIERITGRNERRINEQRKMKFRSILERYIPPHRRDHGPTVDLEISIHPGDKKIDAIYRFLERHYRSPQQKEFHKAFLASCLRIIYGKDFLKERHRVMAKYGFESRKQLVLICAPRRMGKTFATAFFTICVALLINEIEVSIFSPGKRQSVALMGHIYTFMKKLGETDNVVTKNEEKMVVRTRDGKESKINAYPSAVRTLKGVSGTIVVLEEMAQIPPEVLYEVVVPLHQIDITSVIGISTITTEDNFMTAYLNQKDNHGEPLFASKHIYLACKPCRRKGLAHKCNHNSHLLPDWSSPRKRKQINAIMRHQEEMLAREIGGVASSLHQKAFPMKYIKILKELPPYSFSDGYAYDNVFVAIDPNGAGKSSDFAITSMIRFHGLYIVVGMESFPSRTAKENHQLIVEHCDRIREKILFRNARLVFILENNLGLESEHIEDMLKDNVSRHIVMNEKDDGHHNGFRTTNPMKTLAVETTRERILDSAVRIADEEDFVSVTRSYNDIVELFFDQLQSFSEVLRESEVAKPKKFYSGKTNGTSKDDLIISFLLGVHWSGFFYRNPKYAHFM